MAPKPRGASKKQQTGKEAEKSIKFTADEIDLIPEELLRASTRPSTAHQFPDVPQDIQQSLMRDAARALINIEDVEGAKEDVEVPLALGYHNTVDIEEAAPVRQVGPEGTVSVDSAEASEEEEEEEVDYADTDEDGEKVDGQIDPMNIDPIDTVAPKAPLTGKGVEKPRNQPNKSVGFMSTPPVGRKPLQKSRENKALAATTKKLGDEMNEEYIAARTLKLDDNYASKITDAFLRYEEIKQDIILKGNKMTVDEEYVLIEYIAENKNLPVSYVKPLLFGLRKSKTETGSSSMKPAGKIVESLFSLEKSFKRQLEDFTKQNEYLKSTCGKLYNSVGKIVPPVTPVAGQIVSAKKEQKPERGIGVTIKEPVEIGSAPNVFLDLGDMLKLTGKDKGKGVLFEEAKVERQVEAPIIPASVSDQARRLKNLLDTGKGDRSVSDFVLDVLACLDLSKVNMEQIQADENMKYHICYDIIQNDRAEIFDPFIDGKEKIVKTRREFFKKINSKVPSSSK
ncbi:TPA_asm: protein 2 [Silene virus 1]|uniref:Protein 2 n=1 Tax=Silene virus 1 TaxID=2977989 RepID=A0A9N7AB46_9RHAB|nr:TPA_asm: protein 2 [Silene virus 1]